MIIEKTIPETIMKIINKIDMIINRIIAINQKIIINISNNTIKGRIPNILRNNSLSSLFNKIITIINNNNFSQINKFKIITRIKHKISARSCNLVLKYAPQILNKKIIIFNFRVRIRIQMSVPLNKNNNSSHLSSNSPLFFLLSLLLLHFN